MKLLSAIKTFVWISCHNMAFFLICCEMEIKRHSILSVKCLGLLIKYHQMHFMRFFLALKVQPFHEFLSNERTCLMLDTKSQIYIHEIQTQFKPPKACHTHINTHMHAEARVSERDAMLFHQRRTHIHMHRCTHIGSHVPTFIFLIILCI